MAGGDALANNQAAKSSGTEKKAASLAKADRNEGKKEEIPEVDDWGLPIRKRPPKKIIEQDESEDEAFEDASEGPVVKPKDSEGKGGDRSPSKHELAPHARKVKASAEDDSTSKKAPNYETTTATSEQSTTNSQDPRTASIPDKSPSVEPPTKEADAESKAEQKTDHKHKHTASETSVGRLHSGSVGSTAQHAASEWSHQVLVPMTEAAEDKQKDDWQAMPAFAPFDLYNDDGKLIAKEHDESDEEVNDGQLGGAGKGYTRVQMDEDAQSATSMDENTAYLFKEPTSTLLEEDEEGRDMLGQMQATKDIMTEGQRIAYVGLARLAMIEMVQDLEKYERIRATRKILDLAKEAMTMWSQKIMLRLYAHMEIESAEQIMIEQLAEHGVQPSDLVPALMQNALVKNPMRLESAQQSTLSVDAASEHRPSMDRRLSTDPTSDKSRSPTPLPSEDEEKDTVPEVTSASDYAKDREIDIDIRWTVLCDLFLVLIADSIYDSRSRKLLELVGDYLQVSWLDICRFEKRITDAIEMQESAHKEDWNEDDHMEERKKQNKKRRMVMMGLATVGGGLVIGLSAGLLAPLIGAGLAAGFTTFGVAGTGSFLAGAGGATIITTTGIVTGSNIAFKASNRRTGAVQTFEYRPLHNNKRVNLIVTVAGWLTGKVDDVRLPFSTVDPIMGDIYSVYWEPEMLRSMGDTINILATEALTQALQQVLGSTILVALMAALQLPIVLTKLAYLIDNPWTVSMARADLAGLILADSLVDRNLGTRPITLVGFSLGSRVIFACLRELVKRGQFGIIQNVYLFGSPVLAKKDEYTKLRAIVSGRFVNGYATNDWILGYLFRATGGGVMRVAGLAPVEVPGVENYNLTEFVPGHMSYRQAMPRLLREVGWVVESDEFTEIEDPDPENHEKRQRELINEIEEARKQVEEKRQKSRFGWFRKKHAPEKKVWETYDEKVREGTEDKEELENQASGVLFDIEALRAEVAELAAQGIQVKELPQSTLPPMKLDLKPNSAVFTPEKQDGRSSSAPPNKLTFSSPPPSAKIVPDSSSSSKLNLGGASLGAAVVGASVGTAVGLSHASVLERTSTAPDMTSPSTSMGMELPSRPTLTPSKTAPVTPINLEHNAWAEEFEDDFGKEKELTMTFE